MMPDSLPGLEHYWLEWEETPTGWRVYYRDNTVTFEDMIILERTYEDALARTLIYLLENKFLNPEDLYRSYV